MISSNRPETGDLRFSPLAADLLTVQRAGAMPAGGAGRAAPGPATGESFRPRAGALQRGANASWVLLGASGASYLTTFIRERYFYQQAYGSLTLDRLEVALSVAAIMSNLAGVVLAFWWSSGRISSRRMAVIGLASIAAAAMFVVPLPVVGLLLGVLVASAAFLWGVQRAAVAGRQLPALLGAVTAPGFTLATWHLVGINHPSRILLGYLAGAVWQGAVAVAVGIGTKVQATAVGSSLAWPLVYMLAVQVDAVMDQADLLFAGRGWAGAGALSLNFLGAATVVVIGPLAAQAIAGRLEVARWRRIVAPTILVTVAYFIIVPLALPLLIRGGAVKGMGYHRILIFSLLYGLAIPFSSVWQLRTRAAQRDSSQWAPMSFQALALFAMHGAILLILTVLGNWQLVPLATVFSFVAATIILIERDTHSRPPVWVSPLARVTTTDRDGD